MSKRPEDRPNSSAGDMFEASPMQVEEPRRAASLTLRSDEVRQQRAASMEAANRSLADALRITYRLIQAVMVVMVILFAGSGYQQVYESERGIKVQLGRIVNADLAPGPQFSLPYPLGQIIKVPTGQMTVQIDDSFWPKLMESEKNKPLDQLESLNPLRPGVDGSLVTGDANLAHAQWTVVYGRARPADYMQNVWTDDEVRLVQAVVERAAVQVVAETPIDDLLKRGAARAGDGTEAATTGARENDLEARVRISAQKALNDLHAGIDITGVSLRSFSPPRGVTGAFTQVQQSRAAADKQREEALQQGSQILNAVAGSAHRPLLDLIDSYGKLLDQKKTAEADAVLNLIFEVLEGKHDGQDITLNGVTYADVRLSGEVSTIINSAKQYESMVVESAKQTKATFEAKLAQYRSNPRVFVVREWTEAMAGLMGTGLVEAFLLPDGTKEFDLMINSDPQIKKELVREIQRREVAEGQRLRNALNSGLVHPQVGDNK